MTRCPEALIQYVEFTQRQAKDRLLEYMLFICTDSTTPTTEPSAHTIEEWVAETTEGGHQTSRRPSAPGERRDDGDDAGRAAQRYCWTVR